MEEDQTETTGRAGTAAAAMPGSGRLSAHEAPIERSRWHVSYKMSQKLRHPIEQAAAASGRSISAELEWRISQTVRDEDVLQTAMRIAVGDDLAAIAWEIIDTLKWTFSARFALLLTKGDIRDPWSYAQAMDGARHIIEQHKDELGASGEAILAVLEKYRPPGPVVPPAEAGWGGPIPSSLATAEQKADLDRIVAESREAERNVGVTMAKRRLTARRGKK
jgi:hypothetical protein